MLLEKFRKKILLFVILGFIGGIIVGIFLPSFAIHLEFIGTIFLNLIKFMIVPLVFCSVFLGVLNNNHQKIGKLLIISIITFICLFCITLFISFPIAMIINPGNNFNVSLLAQTQASSSDPVTLVSIVNNIIPTNILEPFVTSNILQVIFITLIFSISLIPYKKEIKPMISIIEIFSQVIFKLLNVIMLLSPFAVFSLISTTTATYGISALLSLSQYIFTSYVLFIIIIIVVVIIPIRLLTRFKLSYIFKSMLKLWIIAISTTSSTTSLPTTFSVLENDFNISKDRSRFILPIATTLNMIGGAVSFATLSVFACNIAEISITPYLLVQMIFLSIIINMSAPGIPGGGIVLGTIYLTTLGLPVEIMVLISGIYRIVDMAFTTLNVSGDVVATIIIDRVYSLKYGVSQENNYE